MTETTTTQKKWFCPPARVIDADEGDDSHHNHDALYVYAY